MKKMQDETRAAKEADAEQYEQMQCWCNTNGSEKKEAIAKDTAEAEQLETEIKQLKQQIADNEATLEE